MNNDLISLSDLRKEIKLQKSYGNTIQQRDYGNGFVVSLSILEGKLADFPTVDAEPVRHGRWIENGPDWVCSYCGTEFKDEIEFIKLDYDYCMPHYCPHCGAKMDGGTENADN